MKYGKFFSSHITSYPKYIQDHCIDYIRWKKIIKGSITSWKSKLESDCYKLDRFLYPRIFRTRVPKNLMSNLCLFNTNTLYKICKKIDKMYNNGAMEYYKYVLKSRRFRFTSVSFATLIN